MNTKQIKHYEILSEFFASDFLKKPAVDKYFGALLKVDYSYAEDLWEYMLIRNESGLNTSAIGTLYLDNIFALFLDAAGARAIKTVVDRAVITRAVFTYSPTADGGELFDISVNLLLSNKVAAVDGIFKCLIKNTAMKPSFGEYMIKFLDRYFIELMKKSAQHRVELGRKQSELLMIYAQKVRGDERAMLVQRIKEVM